MPPFRAPKHGPSPPDGRRGNTLIGLTAPDVAVTGDGQAAIAGQDRHNG